MIGFFTILNTLTSTVYPIIASYISFENYSKVASSIEESHINIGGFNVPIHSLLKKAAGETTHPIGHEEQLLQNHLLSIQKWFIYWIVLATFNMIESILFLKYIIPFYSLFKLLLSMWLISPMLTILKSHHEERKPFDQTKDWVLFTENGSGLVYFKCIKPWLEGELSVLSNVSFEPQKLLTTLNKYVGVENFIKSWSFTNGSKLNDRNNNESVQSGTFISSVKSYVFDNNLVNETSVKESSTKGIDSEISEFTVYKDFVDEYDLVDKPTTSNDLTQRKSSAPESEGTKKGWFW